MKCNVGGMDRNIRIVVGIALLLIGLIAPIGTTWQIIALVVAAVALVTAFVHFCPVNAMFGIDTCAGEKKQE